MIVAASVAAIVIAVGGYAWYQKSSERAEAMRQAALLEETKKKAVAEELEAKKRADERAAADALEAKKQAAEQAIAAETEAKRRAQERALAQELDAKRQAQDRAYAQELETKRQAREKAEANEREKIRIAQDKAAAQRARWPSYNFPPPNGGLVVYTIMHAGWQSGPAPPTTVAVAYGDKPTTRSISSDSDP
jgi:hypothetical protein